MMNGSDGPLASPWVTRAAEALGRGWNASVYDGPGQQSMLFKTQDSVSSEPGGRAHPVIDATPPTIGCDCSSTTAAPTTITHRCDSELAPQIRCVELIMPIVLLTFPAPASVLPNYSKSETADKGNTDMSDAQYEARPDGVGAPAHNADSVRQQAIQQIERRRRFNRQLVISGIIMILLVASWAHSEYHNAGGWPTSGFSHRSSIPNVWNYWIVYPIILWASIMGYRGWSTYGGKPISEDDIEKEMRRQS